MNLLINHGLPDEKKFLNISNLQYTEFTRIGRPSGYFLSFFSNDDKKQHAVECITYLVGKYGKDMVVK